MSRRIDVELTSRRDDGSWTWRAAGAKQPKGDLDGGLLYEGAKVGDVVRADADFLMDGIVITGVIPPKGARKEPERLEIIGPPRRDEQLVTTQLAPKGRGGRDGDRRPRREGDRDGRPRREGDRDGRPGGERNRGPRREGDAPRGERERRDRPPRAPRPAPEPKPKPKRLRAGRAHRNEVLAALPEEQKPVAEQVLRGGIPAVRQAVEKQNETNKAEGRPEINAGPLVTLAEQIMPALRTAEWRDKAEAALADLDELDLRDLRSVVVASDVAARDEETRALAEQLRAGLGARVEAEHTAWLAEVDETLTSGRVVRALRVSSRPPKAGTPFPPELASRLADETATSLTPETGSDRYATVLDALAYSPVRGQVTPQGIPSEPTDELLAAVRKLASRIPTIATLFGVEAPAAPGRPGRGRSRGKSKAGGGQPSGKAPIPPPPPAPTTDPSAPTPAAGDVPVTADDPTTAPEPAAADSRTAEPAAAAPEVPEAPEPAAAEPVLVAEEATPAESEETSPEPVAEPALAEPVPVAPERVAAEPEETSSEPVPVAEEPVVPESDPTPVPPVDQEPVASPPEPVASSTGAPGVETSAAVTGSEPSESDPA